MDIKKDILWIQSEIEKVKDPLLIETFKNLLSYRKEKIDDFKLQKEMDEMILQAENDIENNRIISTDELKSQIKKWK